MAIRHYLFAPALLSLMSVVGCAGTDSEGAAQGSAASQGAPGEQGCGYNLRTAPHGARLGSTICDNGKWRLTAIDQKCTVDDGDGPREVPYRTAESVCVDMCTVDDGDGPRESPYGTNIAGWVCADTDWIDSARFERACEVLEGDQVVLKPYDSEYELYEGEAPYVCKHGNWQAKKK